MPRRPRPRRTGGHGRAAKPVWLIGCEDSVSTPNYLSSLFALHPGITYRPVRRSPRRSNPLGVIERIQTEIEQRYEGRWDAVDRVWAIIDSEPHQGDQHASQIDQAMSMAQSLGITVLIVNPCFEHWIRLHIEDCDDGFGSCGELIPELKRQWRAAKLPGEYTKSAADFGRLVTATSVRQAAQWARQQHDRKKAGLAQPPAPHRCPACVTNLYELINALDEAS